MEREQLIRFQKGLGVISGAYHTVGCVFPSGKLDKTTQNAVKELQGLLGIKKSGQIDMETHVRGTELAQKVQKQTVAEKMDIYPCGRVYSVGDKHDIIALVQLMINAVAKRYHNIPAVPVNRSMDALTVPSIRKLRAVLCLAEGSYVDVEFFGRLLHLYCNIRSDAVS